MGKKIPSTSDVYLTEVSGFKVYVSIYGTFLAFHNDTSLSAKTMDDLKELIKEHLRETRRFKPIDVIDISDDVIGRITSRTANDKDRVFFSYVGRGEDRVVRTEASLATIDWSQRAGSNPCFARVTEANVAILTEIAIVESVIDELQAYAASLRKQYTDPVTDKVIEGQLDRPKLTVEEAGRPS